jgi:hypothetical protein
MTAGGLRLPEGAVAARSEVIVEVGPTGAAGGLGERIAEASRAWRAGAKA